MKKQGEGIGGVLLATGAVGLVGAMLIDGIAVVGRHTGIPFTGSIELVQAFIVLGAASAIAYASLGATHAAVDLVFHRLPISAQRLAHRLAAAMLERGIYVIGFSYPVVPKGEARIRVQLSAAHSEADIDRGIAALAGLLRS